MALKEKLVPYSLKIAPSMLEKAAAAAANVKTRFWHKKGITTGAFIRRAIQRDLDHLERSRDKTSETKKVIPSK